MANASDYLENRIIDTLFRGMPYAPPALWVALFRSSPADAGGGAEVTGGGYQRVNLPPGPTFWTATQGGTPAGASTGTGGATANAVTVAFAVPSADWGTVTHFALWDSPLAAGGTQLVWGALSAPRQILNGDPAARFPPGTLQVIVS
jgi:hypothetical protein